MHDDLERRLEQLGAASTTPMSITEVDALETRLLAARRRQIPWRPLLATAAAVLLLAGAVFAMQRTDNDSLRPATSAATSTVATSPVASSTTEAATTSTSTTTTEVITTTTEATPEPTVPGGVPPSNPGNTSPTVPATTPATSPPTAPPTTLPSAPPPVPTTTLPPVAIPPASFTLTVQRVGERLVFSWPGYAGGDGRQYVLVRVGPAGLNTWPVAQARIGAIVGRMNVTTTVVMQPNTEPRRWVLAVVGENRTLLAVSSVAVSA